MALSSINGVALSGLSAIDAVTLSGLSAINGQTIAGGAPTLVIDSQEASGNAHRGGDHENPATWAFNNVAGTLLLVGVVVTTDSGAAAIDVTGITYNGVAMTAIGTAVTWASVHSLTQWFYLVSPATGSNTVSVSSTSGAGTGFRILGGAISFTGQNASPIGTATTGTNSSGTTATAGDITTAAGNYILAVGGWGSGTGGTAGAGFTRTFLLNGSGLTSGDDILGEYKLSVGGATTPTFTWTGDDSWGIQAVEIISG